MCSLYGQPAVMLDVLFFLRFISQAEIINAPNMELYQKKRSLRGPGHRAKGEILFSANMRALKEIKNHNHQERELTPPSTPKHLPRSIKKLSDTLSRYEMNTFIQNIFIIFYTLKLKIIWSLIKIKVAS